MSREPTKTVLHPMDAVLVVFPGFCLVDVFCVTQVMSLMSPAVAGRNTLRQNQFFDFFYKNGAGELVSTGTTSRVKNFIFLEFTNGGDKSWYGEMVKQNACFAIDNSFGGATRIVADNGTTVGHSFNRNNAEVFVVGTKNKGFGL